MAALAALAGACGDTLVDHGALWLRTVCNDGQVSCLDLVPDGGTNACFAEDVTHCGGGCSDCRSVARPDGTLPACTGEGTGEGTCGFECQGGLLKCGNACCTASSVAAGAAHTCAITSATSLVCWGGNAWGQVGYNQPGKTPGSYDEIQPPRVVFDSGVSAVAAGELHTCAVVTGAIRCFGWNVDGQAPPDGPTPALTDVVALAAGQRHTCAIAGSARAVTCWGSGLVGQTGNGTPITSGAVEIAAGRDHTCAVLESGVVQCWGSNEFGQLGNGVSGAPSATPVTPSVSGTPAHVAGGQAHTCVAVASPVEDNNSNSVQCWGAAPGSIFGLEEPQLTPLTPMKDGATTTIRKAASAITAGRTHTCIVRKGEGVECFGPEWQLGQLGAQPPGPSEAVDIAPSASPPGARGVAAGADHSCAIYPDGSVHCWGKNDNGQLGDGTGTAHAVGVIVPVSGR